MIPTTRLRPSSTKLSLTSSPYIRHDRIWDGLILSLAGICRSPNRKLCRMPKSCEVVEMQNSADTVGYPCSRTANTQCSDCGSELCESHAESCSACRSVFCPSCFLFHKAQHSKPAHGERRERKRA